MPISNETQVHVNSEPTKTSLKNIIGKVSQSKKGDSQAYPRPPKQARSDSNHLVQFGRNLEAPAADDSTTNAPSSIHAPKPVGILKNKGPGPIIDSYISEQPSTNDRM